MKACSKAYNLQWKPRLDSLLLFFELFVSFGAQPVHGILFEYQKSKFWRHFFSFLFFQKDFLFSFINLDFCIHHHLTHVSINQRLYYNFYFILVAKKEKKALFSNMFFLTKS